MVGINVSWERRVDGIGDRRGVRTSTWRVGNLSGIKEQHNFSTE